VVSGTMSVSAFGDLGSFSFLGVLPNPYDFQFQNAFGDVFGYIPLPNYLHTSPAFPDVGTYGLRLGVSCGSANDTCVTDGFSGVYEAQGNMYVTQTPEAGGTLIYLIVGLIGSAVLARWNRTCKEPLRESAFVCNAQGHQVERDRNHSNP